MFSKCLPPPDNTTKTLPQEHSSSEVNVVAAAEHNQGGSTRYDDVVWPDTQRHEPPAGVTHPLSIDLGGEQRIHCSLLTAVHRLDPKPLTKADNGRVQMDASSPEAVQNKDNWRINDKNIYLGTLLPAALPPASPRHYRTPPGRAARGHSLIPPPQLHWLPASIHKCLQEVNHRHTSRRERGGAEVTNETPLHPSTPSQPWEKHVDNSSNSQQQPSTTGRATTTSADLSNVTAVWHLLFFFRLTACGRRFTCYFSSSVRLR